MSLTRTRLCILCAVLSAVAAWLVLSVPTANAQAEAGQLHQRRGADPEGELLRLPRRQEADGQVRHDHLREDCWPAERAARASPPASPKDSELYTLIVSEKERRMPPRKDNRAPVPKDKAAVIKKWIKEGAKLDAGLDPKADLVKELRVRWKSPPPPAKYPFPTIINALAFTPDGKQLVVGGHHELTVWDAATGKLVKRIYTRAERAYAMAFLPDGKLAVAGGRPGQEGDVRIYDITATGKTEGDVQILDGVNDPKVMVKQLLDADDSVLCLAVSADGKKLAGGGCDRTVRVWEYPIGQARADDREPCRLGAGRRASRRTASTADCSRDKTAKVWDLKAKESVLTFPDHQNIVFGVA